MKPSLGMLSLLLCALTGPGTRSALADTGKKGADLPSREMVELGVQCMEALPKDAPPPQGYLTKICSCAVDYERQRRIAGHAPGDLLPDAASTETCVAYARKNQASKTTAASPYGQRLGLHSDLLLGAFLGCYNRASSAAPGDSEKIADYCVCLVDRVRAKKVPAAQAVDALGEKDVEACAARHLKK